MQPYILNSFKRNSDEAIFTRVETGSNSGGYVSNTTVQEVKRLKDFICDGNFTIHSVTKHESIAYSGTNVIFTVGDRLSMQYDRSDIIQSIQITNSEAYLYTGITIVSRVDIRVANKFITVIPTVNPEVTRRGPGRPSNVELAARNNTTPNSELLTLETLILSKNTREIRLPGLLRNRKTQTLEAFLTRFFTEWNVEKITIFVDDSTQQTGINKRRSLGDIYMICKYYYPNCTLKEVLTLLYVTLNNNLAGFRTSYCHTINKRVWYYSENSQNLQNNKDTLDEFNYVFIYYINLTNL